MLEVIGFDYNDKVSMEKFYLMLRSKNNKDLRLLTIDAFGTGILILAERFFIFPGKDFFSPSAVFFTSYEMLSYYIAGEAMKYGNDCMYPAQNTKWVGFVYHTFDVTDELCEPHDFVEGNVITL